MGGYRPNPGREAEGERQPGNPGADDHGVVPAARQILVRDRVEPRDGQGRIEGQRESAGGEHGVSVSLTRSRGARCSARDDPSDRPCLERGRSEADEAAVGDAGGGDDREGHEGQEAERRGEPAAEAAGGGFQGVVGGGDLRERAVGEDAGDGQR